MRKIVGLISGLMLVPVTAGAAPFAVVGNTPGRVFILDRGALTRSGVLARGWYYIISRDLGPNDEAFRAINADFDCREFRDRANYSAKYRLDGTIIESNDVPRPWQPTNPNTVAYAILQQACSPDAGVLLLDDQKRPLGLLEVVKAAREGMLAGELK